MKRAILTSPCLAAATAVAVALATPLAQAYPTYSASFQGVTFDVTQTSESAFTFDIHVSTALSGSWTGATYLAAFGLKDLGVDFSAAGVSATAFYRPTGGTIAGVNGQLNGKTCKANGGQRGTICFDPVPNISIFTPATDDMVFDVSIMGATLAIADSGPHLAIMWSKDSTCTQKTTGKVTTCEDDKLGSRYSEDLILSSNGTSSGQVTTSSGSVPEPGSLSLFGAGGLIGGIVAAYRRRRKDPRAA
jgi:hypothetical protein